MVKAWEDGVEHAPRWQDAHTFAAGIRVPQAVGDFLILRAVRDSGGFAIAVDDEAIAAAWREVAAEEGLLLCPEGAATYAAYKAGGRRRPGAARRARRAVQLRDRAQIPDAGGRHAAQARHADRLAADARRQRLSRRRPLGCAV